MKKNKKRLVAIAALLLLAALYIFTFISAFLNIPYWENLFSACLVASVGVPILLWIYMWLYSKVTDKRTLASDLEPDTDAFSADEEEDK